MCLSNVEELHSRLDAEEIADKMRKLYPPTICLNPKRGLYLIVPGCKMTYLKVPEALKLVQTSFAESTKDAKEYMRVFH